MVQRLGPLLFQTSQPIQGRLLSLCSRHLLSSWGCVCPSKIGSGYVASLVLMTGKLVQPCFSPWNAGFLGCFSIAVKRHCAKSKATYKRNRLSGGDGLRFQRLSQSVAGMLEGMAVSRLGSREVAESLLGIVWDFKPQTSTPSIQTTTQGLGLQEFPTMPC